MTDLTPSGIENILRAAQLCAPCIDTVGRMTLVESSEGAIELWMDSVFCRHLAPAFADARHAILTAGAKELAAIDARLDSSLAGPLAAGSRAAGKMLALDSDAPAGEKALARHLAAVRLAEGHFVTLYAARSAVFHVCAATALAGLLYAELQHLPPQTATAAMRSCMARLPIQQPGLRAA